MPTVGLVASQNGLGHARRLAHFSSGFKELGYEVTLLLSSRQHKKLSSEITKICPQTRVSEIEGLGLDGPSQSNHSIQEAPESLQLQLRDLDFVISDNVTWPGKYLSSFLLMGHFTWIDYWQKNSPNRLLPVEQSILEAEKISKWFSPVDFSHQPTLLDNVERMEIPLSQYLTDSKAKKKYDTSRISLSNGTTGLNQSDEHDLVCQFNEIGITLDIQESFTFNPSQLPALTLGRPGLGTIRDCLASGVPFLPFWKGEDSELTNNQATLKRAGLIPTNWEGNQELNFELIRECLSDKSHKDRVSEYWKGSSAPITEIVQMMGF